MNLEEMASTSCRESEINVFGKHIQLNFLLLFCVCLFFIHVSTHSPSVVPTHYLQLKYSQEKENKTE